MALTIQFTVYPHEGDQTFIPIAAGNVISYCKKQKFEFEIIWNDILYLNSQEPNWDADILAMTCFVWNQQKNDQIAKEYKRYNPKGIVVYGGPNVPYDKQDWIKSKPWVDHFIAGIGERLFADLLKNLDNSPKFLYNKSHNRIKPTSTAYLDGTLDSILDNGDNLKALFETNVGCPFGCAYCDWGSSIANKVVKFDDKVIRKTILKLTSYENIAAIGPMDANFGLYERDVEYLKLFLENKKPHHRWKTNGLAKNQFKYLKKIYDLSIDHDVNKSSTSNVYARETMAIQTWSIEALKTINRGNIKSEKFIDLIEHVRSKGSSVLVEMIVGLPGETSESWLEGLHKNFTLNIKDVKFNILEVIHNTPLDTDKFKKENNIKLKTAQVGNHKKRYIYECRSYDLEDLKLQHLYTWWFQTFYTEERINVFNLKEQILDFFDNLDCMPFWKNVIEQQCKNFYKVFDGDIDDHDSLSYVNNFPPFNPNITNKLISDNSHQAYIELEQLYKF